MDPTVVWTSNTVKQINTGFKAELPMGEGSYDHEFSLAALT